MNNTSKKVVVSAVVIVVLVAYIALKQYGAKGSTPSMTASTSSSSASSAAPSATPSSLVLKDGSYTGPVADAYFGNLQVSVTIQGGKIVDVQFPQYPNDADESKAVNNRAMPLLKSEAIAAQSSNVDIVSGATQSSQAFQQSLAGALSQAQAQS